MATLMTMNDLDCDFIRNEASLDPTQRPLSLGDLDVSAGVLEDLALKTIYLSGALSVLDLAEKLCLSYNATNELFSRLRADLCWCR